MPIPRYVHQRTLTIYPQAFSSNPGDLLPNARRKLWNERFQLQTRPKVWHQDISNTEQGLATTQSPQNYCQDHFRLTCLDRTLFWVPNFVCLAEKPNRHGHPSFDPWLFSARWIPEAHYACPVFGLSSFIEHPEASCEKGSASAHYHLLAIQLETIQGVP